MAKKIKRPFHCEGTPIFCASRVVGPARGLTRTRSSCSTLRTFGGSTTRGGAPAHARRQTSAIPGCTTDDTQRERAKPATDQKGRSKMEISRQGGEPHHKKGIILFNFPFLSQAPQTSVVIYTKYVGEYPRVLAGCSFFIW